MRAVRDFKVSWMIYPILIFPPSQHHMHGIVLLINFFHGLWPITHIFLEDEDGVGLVGDLFVGEILLVHAHDVDHFCVAVFH